MEWRDDPAGLTAWQRGLTGYPVVDAGMRELWTTGFMHNRARMIVASFLIKDLLIDWRLGAAWFWDTLVDADLANNSASWQWVAGSGVDAAPYFRVFNPVTQGEQYDPDGSYVRKWAPELSKLPNALIHKPWEAPASILRSAGVELGVTYPHRILDHAVARERALTMFKGLPKSGFDPRLTFFAPRIAGAISLICPPINRTVKFRSQCTSALLYRVHTPALRSRQLRFVVWRLGKASDRFQARY